MKMRFAPYVAALLAMAGSLWALPEAKTVDEAIAKAAAENRTVIVEFTGRDWCTACIHLHDKIFSSEAFDKAVGGQYVVVEIDYPRDPGLIAQISKEEQTRRETLLNSYGLQGMPSVVLLDAEGLPFAIIVGTRPTPGKYLEELAAAQELRAKRDAAFAAAAPLQGLERAKALVAALELLPKACRDKYDKTIGEIVELDPGNTLGYRYMAGAGVARSTQMAELQEITTSFVGRFKKEQLLEDLDKLNDFLGREDLLPEVRQVALMEKASVYTFLRDPITMLKYTKEALELAPDSRHAPRLRRIIQHTEEVVIPRLKASGALPDEK